MCGLHHPSCDLDESDHRETVKSIERLIRFGHGKHDRADAERAHESEVGLDVIGAKAVDPDADLSWVELGRSQRLSCPGLVLGADRILEVDDREVRGGDGLGEAFGSVARDEQPARTLRPHPVDRAKGPDDRRPSSATEGSDDLDSRALDRGLGDRRSDRCGPLLSDHGQGTVSELGRHLGVGQGP